MNIKDLPKDSYARILHTSIDAYKQLEAEFVHRTDEDSLMTPGSGIPIDTGFFKRPIPKTYDDFEIEIISKEEFKKADVWNRKKKIKICDTKITLQEWNNLTDEQRKQHIRIL